MTVFGRDTLITSLQTLVFGPELAIGALRSLAALQAVDDDPSIDAEPGKILHELRRGKGRIELVPYLLRVDWTPPRSFSSCSPRSGGGPVIATDRAGARAERLGPRCAWIEELRRPRRRRFRRVRTPRAARAREPVLEGLRRLTALPGRQACRRRRSRPPRCRATSTTPASERPSSPSTSGTIPTSRSARAKAPGSAATGSTRCSGSRIDRMYALALDGDKQRVDSLCSNLGHLLWSGIVPAEPDRQRRRRARRPGALDRLGRAHDGRGGSRLQPAQLPQRHRLAARHGACRVGVSHRAGYTDLAQLFSLSLIEAARIARLLVARGFRRLRTR